MGCARSLAQLQRARYQLLCISLLFRNSRKPPSPPPTPPRAHPRNCGGPSVAFRRICLVSSPPRAVTRPARDPRASWFPVLLTRRDVLLMKMKGLLIFSLPAESGPAPVSRPSFFPLRGSLPSDTTVSIFLDVPIVEAQPVATLFLFLLPPCPLLTVRRHFHHCSRW